MLLKKFVPARIKRELSKNPKLANFLESIFCKRAIPVYINIPTMLTSNERELLFKLASKAKGDVLEIGCYAGSSAYFLGKGAENSGYQIFSIDSFNSQLERQKGECNKHNYSVKPSKQEVGAMLIAHGLEGRVKLIKGLSHDIAQQWKELVNTTLALMFINGNRGRAYEDFYAWRLYLRKGALYQRTLIIEQLCLWYQGKDMINW